MHEVHKTLVDWGVQDGIQTQLPAGKNVTSTTIIQLQEARVTKETLSNLRTRDDKDYGEDKREGDDEDWLHTLADKWNRAGHNGSNLLDL